MKPSHSQGLRDLKITREQVAEGVYNSFKSPEMHSGSSSHQTLQFMDHLTETKTAGEGTHADVSSTNPARLPNESPGL